MEIGNTQHYEIIQWVDYARGLAPADASAGMRSHLGQGCAECTRIAKFCERLARACLRMATREVPEPVVRRALAIFPARLAPPRRAKALGVPMELIFDSFLMPLPVGLRSSWQVGWQGLFRSGECSLDIRIEPELQSSRATLIGQVANHATPDLEMGNSAVFLKDGQVVVAETVSNRFGEFQMEYEQRGGLQLCVYIDEGTRCLLAPVKRLAQDPEPAAEGAGVRRSARDEK